MKVALISAPNLYTSGRTSPSLSLGILSSCLRKHNIECIAIDANNLTSFSTAEVKIEDSHLEKRVLNECLELLINYQPDLIGISCWGISVPFAMILSRAVKKSLPLVPIIIGGIRDKFTATMVLRHEKQVTAVAYTEGEMILLEMVHRLENNQNLRGIKGIIHYHNNDIYCEPSSEALASDSWSKPNYSSFILPLDSRSFLVEGSRSCSYNCVYCSINHEPLRRKSPKAIAEEMTELKQNYGCSIVFLADNYVPLKGSWIEKLCDALLSKQIPIPWTCSTRADNISFAVVKKMVQAGCRGIFLGVESTSYETLKYLNKTQSVSQYLSNLMKNIYLFLDLGIKLRVSTIIGFPFEGIGEIQRTTDFVLNLIEMGVDAYTGPVIVYPGSELWRKYENKEIELRKIINPEIRRNIAGLFSTEFTYIPYFVPNNFLPQHKFIDQEELEWVIGESLKTIRDYKRAKKLFDN